MTADYDDFISDINHAVKKRPDLTPDQLEGAADHLEKAAERWRALEVSG